jgi:hypothetical protein
MTRRDAASHKRVKVALGQVTRYHHRLMWYINHFLPLTDPSLRLDLVHSLTRQNMIATTLSLALCGLVGVTEAFGPAARSILHSTILERTDQLNAEYDYVIVGGGTAGLTVADRLTESGQHSVLVIELGVFRKFDPYFHGFECLVD